MFLPEWSAEVLPGCRLLCYLHKKTEERGGGGKNASEAAKNPATRRGNAACTVEERLRQSLWYEIDHFHKFLVVAARGSQACRKKGCWRLFGRAEQAICPA